MNKTYTLLLLILCTTLSWSQVTNEGKPISWKLDVQNLDPIDLPDFDLKKLQKEDQVNDERDDVPWRFGYEHSVSYGLDNTGTWETLPNGDRIWLVSFKSEGAKTLNFIFDQFYLPEGAKLYFYNEDRTDLLGAYTHTQNSDEMVFGSWLIEGEQVFVEYYEPKEAMGKGDLNISQVVHGYRSVTENDAMQKALNDSGACNLDVDCPIGDDFEDMKDYLKKSVAMTVVGGNGFCTGTLINNTSNNGAQYFLTANHCLGGGVGSWAFRFNWTSPNPVCASFTNSQNGTFDQTASGAVLRASNSKSDMALLEINPNLPDSWDLVWAGWDRSNTNPTFEVGIHHPSGDIMKVCRDDDGATQSTTPFNGDPSMQMWLVNNWEEGVTEPGSSGSALFDQNGRIIGQLAGGGAACSGTSNNGQIDFYGRFATSWDFGNTNSTRLSNWLDPNNTGQTTLDVYPAMEVLDVDAAVSINGLDDVCDNNVSPEIVLTNAGNDPITSLSINYAFNEDAPTNIDWSGNLLAGETETISVPQYTLQVEENTFVVDIDLNGDEDINNNQATTDFVVAETVGSSNLVLTIELDNFPDETTWEVVNSSETVVASGGPYSDTDDSITEDISLDNDDCYTFTIFDAYGDGICCGFGSGSYTLETDAGDEIISGGDFDASESVDFNNFISLSNDTFELNNNVKLYPNPTNGTAYISNTSGNLVDYQIYTISGRLISKGEARANETQINLNQANAGIYLVKLTDQETQVTSTQKLIVK
ncbi:T9SS type A sorting domain-containing protein [Psychroflexus planctonicus]|uniref:Secretion system C-terminal sorting domain-containing protein n=1 Tax=Psychroflexus planctonicus TaxID=1526575 RepID=A0ABQ1SDY2_9FLAO|nr:T9SS type A sorting domain-containing protein [Psychroflexus planctonicus]GGE25940.1 hypothetical protein GCM10010832_03330 [Psychroflexus planctonicus]